MKVGVVGAGIGGIHLSYLLRKYHLKPNDEIIILDKYDRLGGKIQSLRDDNGTIHEMGACYLSPAYKNVYNLLDSLGGPSKLIPVPARIVVNTDGQKVDFFKWAIQEAKEILKDRKRSDYETVLRLTKDTLRYSGLCSKLLRDANICQEKLPKEKVRTLLAKTLGDFLIENKLESLRPIFQLIMSAQGYGYIQEIPLYYGIYWVSPATMRILVGQVATKLAPAKFLQTRYFSVFMLKDGFEDFARKVFGESGAIFERNAEVVDLDRFSIANKVNITYLDKKRKSHQLIVDKVILACDLKQSLKFLDYSQQEYDAFSNLEHYRFISSIVEANQLDGNKSALQSWMFKLNPGDFDFHPITQRYSAALFGNQTLGRDRRVTYQFGKEEPFDQDEVLRICQDQIRQTASDVKIVSTSPMDQLYFPHFSGAAIKSGAPWRLFKLQGQNKTVYTGASASFESVASIVDYNIVLGKKVIKKWLKSTESFSRKKAS